MAERWNRGQGDELRRMLWRMLPDRGLTLSLVAGLGGDHPLSAQERQRLEELKARQGQALYSDLLFTLTHQWFEPEKAEDLWNAILKHKYEISDALKRNVGITVAAVDYLYNLRQQGELPSVVDERAMWEMAEAAVRDSLTRFYNLPTLCMHLDAEIKRYKRFGIPVALVIGDIDNFKRVNDRWGHQQGDMVLREIAGLIGECVRDMDICARWGGEEFAVLLPQTGREGAKATGERMRRRIEQALRARQVTMSVGVASCPEDAETVEGLVEKADLAMYRSKQSGKNRVSVFRPARPSAVRKRSRARPPAAVWMRR